MLKKVYYMISIISVIILFSSNEGVYANQKNTPPTIEGAEKLTFFILLNSYHK